MNVRVPSGRSVIAGSAALLMVVSTGCARVKPDELSAQLAELRAEMRSEYQQGDQRVASDLGSRIEAVDARLDAVADELGRLSDEFDVTVERLEGAIRFNAPVFFTFDDATIRPEDRAVLDRFADVIESYYPDVAITAEGFTDSSGNAEYNKALGKRRAEAVVAYLANEGGLDLGQLRAVSYGEETTRLMDAQRGPGSAGVRNRRVVLVIDGTLPPVDANMTTNN
jgi:peptidoglycan-associated lipoprotein